MVIISVPDFYKVAQVFMVIGCILLTSAVGISVVVMLGKGSKSMPVFIIAMFSAAGKKIVCSRRELIVKTYFFNQLDFSIEKKMK